MSIIKYVPKSHEKEDREERKGQIIKKSFFYAKDLKFYSEICKSYWKILLNRWRGQPLNFRKIRLVTARIVDWRAPD